MERETGIEPVTSSLGSWRSTAELLPLNVVGLQCLDYHPDLFKTTVSHISRRFRFQTMLSGLPFEPALRKICCVRRCCLRFAAYDLLRKLSACDLRQTDHRVPEI